MPGTTDVTLNWVRTTEDAMQFMRWLGERRPILAVDTETEGFDWWVDGLRTVQFGDRHTGWCLEKDLWWGTCREALERYDEPIAMHNAKFDTHFLEVNGAAVKRWLVHDSRAMAHVLDPSKLSGLKPRAAQELGPWAMHGQDELKQAMAGGGFDFKTVPVELLWQYAAFDTVLTAQLAEELLPRVMRERADVYGLELASTQVLMDMERRGILTDRAYLAWAQEEWGRDMHEIEHRIKERFGITNPNSDKQVVDRLRAAGWQPVLFTDKGNVKLDSDVLGGLVDGGSDLAAAVLEYREVHKLLGTYVDNLFELAGPDGRLHASINPLGARTGRMSVSRPSLQNLPAKDARIRNAFVAATGNSLISADYDQVEMRIFAHMSGSRTMIDAIRYGDWMTAQGHKGYDLHSMNARMTFGIGIDEPVPPKSRKRVKGVGFAKVYGSGLETFAATAGLPLNEAAAVIEAYETAFPETRKSGFAQQVTAKLHERKNAEGDPYVVTPYGRKQPCWPTEAYKAVNYLIQGTAADVLKDRLVALSRTWLGDHMLLPIHDEVIFEVPQDAVQEAMATIKAVMPENERFAVPLTVDAEATFRWGDLAKYHENDRPAAA
jgi:DNA polymerase-1